ncbi:PREDICTED: uncharacterized protein LOC105566460 [Vollenhovia emeryi]|uniref:uncharacterized protein LOC105566460 n=1 Tax=Vollenhovia emeryi TaxID=411798 RepID=UPI0005F3E67F|nr:PREDICTED: uncharacterized protein LOC105566460 [Vollenhovia emeryi]
MTIDDDKLMVSLDVTAPFTNIPKELVTNGIRKRWHDISRHTAFSLPQFLYAIDLVLSSTYFCFNGRFYEQIFGSPMGSPLSPILADIVMDDLETNCLQLLRFEVPVFFRYVDDIFAIVPKNRVSDMLNVFNNYHPRLKFTHETEINNSIAFLNTLVIRDNELDIRYIFECEYSTIRLATHLSEVDPTLALSPASGPSASITMVKDPI